MNLTKLYFFSLFIIILLNWGLSYLNRERVSRGNALLILAVLFIPGFNLLITVLHLSDWLENLNFTSPIDLDKTLFDYENRK